MTVHCEGDRALLEQQGDRYDFEAELTRQGFRHVDFTLHLLREVSPGEAEWAAGYAVTVVNLPTERRRIYRRGGGRSWVPEFARDLAAGTFGSAATETSPASVPAASQHAA